MAVKKKKTNQESVTTNEVVVVEQVSDQPATLPDYAILNPEIPMSAKVGVATNVANTLAPLVREQGLTVKGLNNKNKEAEYVMVEGWEVLGTMLGCTPYVESVEEIPTDHKHKFMYKATVSIRQGDTILSRASAMAERNNMQKDRPSVYSMAQTRALGKAYRMALSWIVKMADYEPTPAEEMPRFKQSNTGSVEDDLQRAEANIIDVEAE